MPAITKPSDHFDAKLYTGNTPSTNAITGLGFSPGLVWTKSRTAAESHNLVNSVVGNNLRLKSNETLAEASATFTLDSNGFTVGSNSESNNGSMVGWAWKAGGAAVTNTSGSISSQVSANPTAGFSVVTYTGTGSNATVGHGLGVAPSMVIVKIRSTTGYWTVQHSALGSGYYGYLNSTNSFDTANANLRWNGTNPSSTVFSIGTASDVNTSSATYVAYCFAPIADYSSFGSYTGNGSADGPFVYTGFRPRWVMWKRTDSVNDWYIIDTSRSPYNEAINPLSANLTSLESSLGTNIDFLSNGFKPRQTGGHINASGGTYIYMAFAEASFKFASAR